jgi:nicotinamidase-related amidase
MSDTALLIIDIQNDYFEGGKNPLDHSAQAATKAKEMLSFFRQNGMLVIHIRHLTKRPNVDYFIPETKGSEIHNIVKPNPGEKVIIKHHPNSFIDTDLLEYLRSNDISNLVICGMMTHMCIDSTTRAAKDYDFNCFVISDACATKKLSINDKTLPSDLVHNAFMAALKGYYAHIETAQEYINRVGISE